MAKFNGFILTEKGRELLAKGLAGETITFTKMAIGDGTNVKRNGTCEINALLTNKSVTTGFYIKELGIFAHGNDNVEILYAYNISTSPDFVPPFSANNVVEIEYVDTIIVDQVANVTAVIDPSITYITKKYADENYLVSSRLAEILGLQFGGNIQDIGNKIKGKFYYDSVTKFYYECIEDNSLTYNDSGKFRAISNKPISDKLENLLEVRETVSANNPLLGTTKFFRIGKRVYFFVYFQNTSGFLMMDGTKIADYQQNFFPDTFFYETEHAIMNRNNAGTENARLVIRSDGIYVYGLNGKTHYELKGTLHYISQ